MSKIIMETQYFKNISESLSSNNTVQNPMTEIETMDAALIRSIVKEKDVKLSRILAEKEFLNISASLRNQNISKALHANFEEFMKLLNESVQLYSGQEKNTFDNRKHLEKKKLFDCKKCIKRAKFVEKNIQLAKCGNGVLSLTNEEEARLKTLLKENENENRNYGKTTKTLENKNCLGKKKYKENDGEVVDLLKSMAEIDERLKVFEESRNWDSEIFNKNFIIDEEVKTPTEKHKHFSQVERKGNNEMTTKESKMKSRLKEIDLLLSICNSAAEEEINPLSKEDIEKLIKETQINLTLADLSGSDEDCKAYGRVPCSAIKGFPSHPKLSKEILSKLVLKAKVLMPNFKYRYNEA